MKRLVHRPVRAATRWVDRVTSEAARTLWQRMIAVLGAGFVTWICAGLVFYVIEPTTKTWFEGVWLAFTTGATVGYGDFVPTTLASRVFAVITVLLGLAFLSVATASIAALFVGENERQVEADILNELARMRTELAALRAELQAAEEARDAVRHAARSAPPPSRD